MVLRTVHGMRNIQFAICGLLTNYPPSRNTVQTETVWLYNKLIRNTVGSLVLALGLYSCC